QLAGEGKRRVVVRDRARAVATDVETRPRDEADEAHLRLEAAGLLAVDQQGGDVVALGAPHAQAQQVIARRYRPVRNGDMVLTTHVHVVGQPVVLDVERVAAGHVAVGDQHALGRGPGDLYVGLDRVGAAAHVGRD